MIIERVVSLYTIFPHLRKTVLSEPLVPLNHCLLLHWFIGIYNHSGFVQF